MNTMNAETIGWIIGSTGLATIGIAFMIKTLITSGIKKAVELNFNKHLENYKATLSQELESLKSTLKNSEVFFVRQLEALSQLRSLYRKILPERDYPDMEWPEALEKIADSYKQHSTHINDYMSAYDALLPVDVREQLERAAYAISEIRFQFDYNSKTLDATPNSEALENAELYFELIKKSIDSFQECIELQLGNRKVSTSPAKTKKEIA